MDSTPDAPRTSNRSARERTSAAEEVQEQQLDEANVIRQREEFVQLHIGRLGVSLSEQGRLAQEKRLREMAATLFPGADVMPSYRDGSGRWVEGSDESAPGGS